MAKLTKAATAAKTKKFRATMAAKRAMALGNKKEAIQMIHKWKKANPKIHAMNQLYGNAAGGGKTNIANGIAAEDLAIGDAVARNLQPGPYSWMKAGQQSDGSAERKLAAIRAILEI